MRVKRGTKINEKETGVGPVFLKKIMCLPGNVPDNVVKRVQDFRCPNPSIGFVCPKKCVIVTFAATFARTPITAQLEKCYKHVIRYRLSYITLLKVDQHNVLELEEVDIARS